MLGAILGDIVGSPYEFDHNNYKHKDFPLLSEKSHFTDDTVMTAAVAVGLIDGKGLPERTFCAVQHEMRFWGREYPHAGYGGMFRRWLHAENPKPYGSFGNGSAMRVSAAGWLFDTLDKTLEMAKVTAEVTHNHPEGIKGAQATAAAIFLARTGHSKPEIKRYVEQTFGYDLNRTCDEIRPTYHHVETCQETVPEAIIAFLESVSFEDALRNAVSLGGDSDTLACITGGIAEAFYGMPQELRDETVCLLSKLNAKQHIEVDIHMDELDLTDAEKKATYSEIKEYVLEHTGLKVSSLYIAQVKQKCGIIERENYNKPKSDDAKQPQCPPDKEKAIKEALKHFGMI